MTQALKIFYTLPYYVAAAEKERYIQFLIFADIAKKENINFEMICFQDSPGRFLTEKVVYDAMQDTDDSVFPITVLNDKIVKLNALPDLQEFFEWFESLCQMSAENLLAKQKEAQIPELLSDENSMPFCSASACAHCPANCNFRRDLSDCLDLAEDLPFFEETQKAK